MFGLWLFGRFSPPLSKRPYVLLTPGTEFLNGAYIFSVSRGRTYEERPSYSTAGCVVSSRSTVSAMELDCGDVTASACGSGETVSREGFTFGTPETRSVSEMVLYSASC